MASTAEVLETALKLSTKDRARVAHELLVSLDETENPAVVREAWSREIDRRIATIDDGTAEYVDHDVAMRQIREKLKAR